MNDSWVFFRKSGRDYGWHEGRPNLPSDVVSWLESLPAAIISRGSKSDHQPICFSIMDGSRYISGYATLCDERDEYGRETSKVILEAKGQVHVQWSSGGNAEIHRCIDGLNFSQNGYEVLRPLIDGFRLEGRTYFFGPRSHVPKFQNLEIIVDEKKSIISLLPCKGGGIGVATVIDRNGENGQGWAIGAKIFGAVRILADSPILLVRKMDYSGKSGAFAELVRSDGRSVLLSIEQLDRLLRFVDALNADKINNAGREIGSACGRGNQIDINGDGKGDEG